jgi:hypothetical protein
LSFLSDQTEGQAAFGSQENARKKMNHPVQSPAPHFPKATKQKEKVQEKKIFNFELIAFLLDFLATKRRENSNHNHFKK